jgi:hypothetical protein
MSTPERQQDEGEYGYGAATQGNTGDEPDVPQEQPDRPADDPSEENPVESPAAPPRAAPTERRDATPSEEEEREDVERQRSATPSTTGAQPEQAPGDQQAG